MAPTPVVFSLVFLLSAAAKAQHEKPSNLVRLDSWLSPIKQHTSWFSQSGLFAFGFYQQGKQFAVGIWLVDKHDNYVVWTANRDHHLLSSKATLNFTKDGKLLIQTELGEERPIAELQEPAAAVSLLDSGNFVIYNKRSKVIWKSFDFPTDTILGGQTLSMDSRLISSVSRGNYSSSGRFRLEMQVDGNLVSYPLNSIEAYWATQTFRDDLFLSLNKRGLLCLREGNSINVHTIANSSHVTSNGSKIIYRATLDADGIFRLYSHSFGNEDNSSVVSTEWSALPNQCEVYGFCGLNSFCSSINGTGSPDCFCFPGFKFTNPDNKILGCYRTLRDEQGCGRKEPALFYNITVLKNVSLYDPPYCVEPMDEDSCRNSCLEDCDCAASFHLNGICNKYKLPLGDGRANQNVSATAFIKVGLEIGGNPDDGNNSQPNPRNQIKVIENEKKKLILILAVSLGCITVICCLIATTSFYVYRNRVHRYRMLSENSKLEGFALLSFSYKELEKATDGFKEELGRDPCGTVYKGCITEANKMVAVKRLESVLEGEREFRAEISVIMRTHHRNLVRLLGFCMDGSNKLLVYEYMRNGSLADLLFKSPRPPIWSERLRIALDVARGIYYLHEECDSHIIHCDIRPQNILMDDSWTAKISHFGLAMLLMPNQTGAMTTVRGTRGYLAPEWHKNVLISVKADVYSYGVVLLEIVCCRSNMEVNVSTPDEVLLSTWVYNCFLDGALDKLVQGQEVDKKSLERMVKVGLLCIQDDPDLRPSMMNVILMLEGTMDIPLPQSPTSSSLLHV